jgi:hypothetical protein
MRFAKITFPEFEKYEIAKMQKQKKEKSAARAKHEQSA